MFSLFQNNTLNSVHVSEIDSKLSEIELIDIREPYEYAHGSIKTSKNIPMGQLLIHPEKYLTKDKQYHIMCQSGGRSTNAVAVLSKAGFDVVNVKGGMGSYAGNNRR